MPDFAKHSNTKEEQVAWTAAWQHYEKSTLSIEVMHDGHLQRVYFAAEFKVRKEMSTGSLFGAVDHYGSGKDDLCLVSTTRGLHNRESPQCSYPCSFSLSLSLSLSLSHTPCTCPSHNCNDSESYALA